MYPKIETNLFMFICKCCDAMFQMWYYSLYHFKGCSFSSFILFFLNSHSSPLNKVSSLILHHMRPIYYPHWSFFDDISCIIPFFSISVFLSSSVSMIPHLYFFFTLFNIVLWNCCGQLNFFVGWLWTIADEKYLWSE